MSILELPTIDSRPQPVLPSSLVVRYGYLKLLGEFSYNGDARPRCGQKLVVRTRRGTELADYVTTTCANTGCATSVSRDAVRAYIDRSGGDDFPMFTDGRVLRIATAEDLAQQRHLERDRLRYVQTTKRLIEEMRLTMRLAEVEVILGGEVLTFYFTSEHRVDFRALVKAMATEFHTRIQMHQVGARDEARVAADYETCGQHCCCRQFLKVLRPVNMGSAKMQKATLDPQKVSGRCGRLKCCLRYEEQNYEELRRKLPRVNSRVRLADGLGTVVQTMILTQLVKVRLDSTGRWVAIANEEILERDIRETREERQARMDREGTERRPHATRPEPAAQSAEPAAPATSAEAPAQAPAETSDAILDQAAPESDPHPDTAPPPQPQSPDAPRGVGSMGRRRRRRRRGGGPATPTQA